MHVNRVFAVRDSQLYAQPRIAVLQHLDLISVITAARPAYAGTEGCYILRLVFSFFFI